MNAVETAQAARAEWNIDRNAEEAAYDAMIAYCKKHDAIIKKAVDMKTDYQILKVQAECSGSRLEDARHALADARYHKWAGCSK